jgi:DNA-binding transcriptional regulator YhcF (GntR family)
VQTKCEAHVALVGDRSVGHALTKNRIQYASNKCTTCYDSVSRGIQTRRSHLRAGCTPPPSPSSPANSVRALSKQLKINPNTAQKVVARLADAGLLEIGPGSVAIIAKRASVTKAERKNLLGQQFEELVVEGKRLGIDLQEMQEAIATTGTFSLWRRKRDGIPARDATNDCRNQNGRAHQRFRPD